MAVAVEGIRPRQAEFTPQRESSRSLATPELLQSKSFLETLDPRLPRPTAVALGPELDHSDLKQYMIAVYRLSQEPELREAFKGNDVLGGRSETVIFSDHGKIRQVKSDETNNIVEAGQNCFLDPKGGKNTFARPVWGEREKLQSLFKNLNTLAESGKYPIHTMHTHPPESLAFPSIQDMLIFRMQRRRGEKIPLVNAMTILGSGVQVTGVRVAESQSLLPDKDIWQQEAEWQHRYKYAGGEERAARKRTLKTLQGQEYIEEKKQYDEFLKAAKDRELGMIAADIGWKFFLSTNMETAIAMPPVEIIRVLRDRQKIPLQAV